MPLKPDQNISIKEFLTTSEKNPNKSKGNEQKSRKTNAKNNNMTKEGNSCSKGGSKLDLLKSTKSTKELNKTPTEKQDNPLTTTTKRDAASRSPLEGNPEKKKKRTPGHRNPTTPRKW